MAIPVKYVQVPEYYPNLVPRDQPLNIKDNYFPFPEKAVHFYCYGKLEPNKEHKSSCPNDQHKTDVGFSYPNDQHKTDVEDAPTRLTEEIVEHACGECTKTFPSEEMLKDHRLSLHVHHCYICGRFFRNRKFLASHMDCHYSLGGIFPCQVCRLSFPRKHQLETHMLENHTFLCTVCGLYLKFDQVMDESHVQTHYPEHFLNCKGCMGSQTGFWYHIYFTVLNE